MIKTAFCAVLVLSTLRFGTAAWAANNAPSVSTPAPAAPPDSPAKTGPRIEFEAATHDFGRALEGERVKGTYVFTNNGDATLEVTGVHACGCITIGDYSKKVEPGQTGAIPISFNSAGYGGAVTKTINVSCNDQQHSRVMLTWKGTVWKALEVNPQMTVLDVNADSQRASRTVKIVNNLDEPLTLSAPESNNKQFSAEVKEIKPGKEFEVVISTVPPLTSGNLRGEITLKTSSTRNPTLKLTAYANVRSPIQASPALVQVPFGPLTNDFKQTITILNKSSTPVKLTDPSINAAGAEAVLREVQPGFKFEADLTFHPGFELQRGQRVHFTAKTDLPIDPEVQVNIFQPWNRNALGRPQQAKPVLGVPSPQASAAH